MAMNPNSIMADLRMKSDKELQAFAAMHKNDPFIFPLAFQESQTRQRMRMAQEAQMAGQEQPKVVDQDLAQMMPQVAPQQAPQQEAQLPEDSGIAQLPAQNMQGMAVGGIVAFDEGGEVPRFNGTTGSAVGGFRDIYNMTPEEIKEAAARKLRSLSLADTFRSASAVAPEAGSTSYLQGLKSFAGKALGPLSVIGQNLYGTSDEEMKILREADARRAMKDMPESTFKGTGDTSDIDKMAEDMAATQAAAQPGATTGKPDATGTKPPAGPKPPAAPGADTGLAALAAGRGGSKSALFQKEALPTKDDYNKEYDALYKGLDEKNAKFLEGQKSKLKTDREEALYMSMIKGGLAAAAGTSKNALQNIAQGFGQGAEDFNASLKDFRRAAQETAKAELEMERAQADRKAGRMDKYDARMEKVKDRELEADKAILSANTTLQAAQTTAGAHLKAAGMPGAQERLFASLGGGDVAKGLEKYQAAQTDKTGLGFAKLYVDHLSTAKEKGFDPMSEQDFLATMSRMASQMNPKVVSDPKGAVLPR